MANIHRISLQFVTKDGVRLQPVTFEVRDGDKGDQGIPGKTAYEVWLEMPGNAGKTEEQYQEFLKADITISQSTGTSTTAVMSQKATTDGLNGRVPVGRQINGKSLGSDVTLSPADVGAYSKAETDTKVNALTKATSDNATAISGTTQDLQDYKVTANENFVPKTRKINGKGLSTDITLTPADIGSPTSAEFTTGLATKVPTSRKINGKPLTADVTLVAGDVGTYSKSEIDLKMDGAAITIEQTTGSGTDTLMSQKATTDALNGKVPTSRKVNGKPLSTDISLTHTDVGAVGKNEAANDSLRLGGATPATGGTANTVAVRNSSGELAAKSLVTTVAVNTTPTAGSEFAIRQSANKAMEFVTPAKAAELLGAIGNDTLQQGLSAKVDKTTKVNGKALTGDITLVPGDVNTYSKTEIDTKVSAATVSVLQVTGSSTTGVMSQKATTDAIGGRVPTTRKVNGKVLTTDIALTAEDVDAYTKTEVDSKLGNIGTRWSFTAEGGETTVTPGFSFKNCVITINGLTQPSPYSFVVENNIITLAGPLNAGELLEMVVIQ